MLIAEAYDLIGALIAPFPVGNFLGEIVGARFVKISGAPDSARCGILGEDPEAAILQAFDSLAAEITSHAAAPQGPPPASEPLDSEAAFRAKIDAFHARGYTVRIPELRPVCPGLDRYLRAMETILHQPVDAAAFWSRGDAKAPVHHDEKDILVIQLRGGKRWYISTDPSELPNDWKSIPRGTPTLDRFEVVDVEPGDMLYLPRGTTHRVDALADSLHLSIGFIPLTVREAIIAALDHLSDLDRPLREGVGNHLGLAIRRGGFGDTPARIRAGLARLSQACASDDFITQALHRRSSRVIGNLGKLPIAEGRPALSRDTVLRQTPNAMFHLMSNDVRLDFSYPGGHLYIHKGALQSVLFIAETPQFPIRDVPGDLSDAVRIALVERFLEVGFLEIAPVDAAAELQTVASE